jgi:hypothetical protein
MNSTLSPKNMFLELNTKKKEEKPNLMTSTPCEHARHLSACI